MEEKEGKKGYFSTVISIDKWYIAIFKFLNRKIASILYK